MTCSAVLCREDAFSREVGELQQRCQDAEARHEQLAAALPSATTPLLRQLEAMQRSAQQHAAAWAATEAALSQRVTDADAAAAAAGVCARPAALLCGRLVDLCRAGMLGGVSVQCAEDQVMISQLRLAGHACRGNAGI